MNIELEVKDYVGGGGTNNYNGLTNKPRINGVELEGNKTPEELGITKDIISESEDNGYIQINGINVKVYQPEPLDAELSEISENGLQNKVISESLKGKAPINSPNFTGVPTAPTAIQGTNSRQIATTEFVQNALSGVVTGEFELIKIVQELPEIGEPNKIYLVPLSPEADNNKFNEFLWVNYLWEYIGAQALSLDGYVKETDLVPITVNDMKELFGEVENAEI